MDSDSWTRVSNYSRRYQSRSDYGTDVYHGEEYEGEEEQRPEYLCPFCAEEYDTVGLCCHIDEEHAVEAKNGVCPVCSRRVGSDLIRHLTMQHGNLLKVQRRRRFRRGGSNLSFSTLRRELREGNLQSLLGGSSFLVSSSHTEPDPLLTSFMHNSHVVDEPSSLQPLSSIEASSTEKSSVEGSMESRVIQQSPLSDEDLTEKTRRCEFAQGLVLSTFLDDSL